MRLGRLDKLITIERQVVTGVSSVNEPVLGWVEHRKCWAEAYDVRGEEAFVADTKQRLAETTTRLRIHFNDAAGVDATMRISYGGAHYDIKSVVVDHVRKQSATIDAVAQRLTVPGATLSLFAEIEVDAVVGEIYQGIIHIFGGGAPYQVGLVDGSPAAVLPPGLNLVQASETSWSLEGFPTQAGTWVIPIVVTDAANNMVFLEPITLTVRGV